MASIASISAILLTVYRARRPGHYEIAHHNNIMVLEEVSISLACVLVSFIAFKHDADIYHAIKHKPISRCFADCKKHLMSIDELSLSPHI